MLTGVLLVDKPSGKTSMEVVEALKKRFNLKAGHAGTLDPIATGLLVILLGEATKFSQFFLGLDKDYVATVKLGEITQTYDREGVVVEQRLVNVSCDQVKMVLEGLVGRTLQTPPPFSAKRIRGKRAYQLARKGIQVEIKPVEVEVKRAELLSCNLPYAEVFFSVSSGTYIRSLVYQMGLQLGCGAHVVELRRLRVGKFNINMAMGLDRILSLQDIDGLVIPLDQALDFLPAVNLWGESLSRIKKGAFVKLDYSADRLFVRLYGDGVFLGLGLVENNKLKPYRLMQGL
ncbi:MAG: tRNA pseudouridine(55) synthase TruB [Aquificaceae bacterium]|nr:tRNA pseudouridine(55) synthase TruB [Aquificaceae bacterium]